MLIWLIQTGESHPFQQGARKMRTAILADHLHARGHSIVWWSTNFYHQKKVLLSPGYKEVVVGDNYVIKLIKGLPYRKNVSLRRYFHQRSIVGRFKKLAALCERPEIIIASMPDHNFAYEAVRFGKVRGIPVLIDIRDLWPDIFIDHVPRKFQNIARWFLKSDFKRLEIALRDADALIAVSGGYLDWGLKKAGRPRQPDDSVFYLGYLNPDSASPSPVNAGFQGLLDNLKGKTVFTFLGTFGMSYDLSLIVEAARKIEKMKLSNVHFVLAGDGEKYQEIKKMSEGMSNITLPGWLNKDEIFSLLRISHVGLVSCLHTKDTVPNKPFEYLAYGLPILSSLRGEMEIMINKYKIGYTYQAGDVDGFCDVVARFANDSTLLKELSENAKGVFNQHFDARNIYEEYAEHIEAVAYESKKRGEVDCVMQPVAKQ